MSFTQQPHAAPRTPRGRAPPIVRYAGPVVISGGSGTYAASGGSLGQMSVGSATGPGRPSSQVKTSAPTGGQIFSKGVISAPQQLSQARTHQLPVHQLPPRVQVVRQRVAPSVQTTPSQAEAPAADPPAMSTPAEEEPPPAQPEEPTPEEATEPTPEELPAQQVEESPTAETGGNAPEPEPHVEQPKPATPYTLSRAIPSPQSAVAQASPMSSRPGSEVATPLQSTSRPPSNVPFVLTSSQRSATPTSARYASPMLQRPVAVVPPLAVSTQSLQAEQQQTHLALKQFLQQLQTQQAVPSGVNSEGGRAKVFSATQRRVASPQIPLQASWPHGTVSPSLLQTPRSGTATPRDLLFDPGTPPGPLSARSVSRNVRSESVQRGQATASPLPSRHDQWLHAPTPPTGAFQFPGHIGLPSSSLAYPSARADGASPSPSQRYASPMQAASPAASGSLNLPSYPAWAAKTMAPQGSSPALLAPGASRGVSPRKQVARTRREPNVIRAWGVSLEPSSVPVPVAGGANVPTRLPAEEVGIDSSRRRRWSGREHPTPVGNAAHRKLSPKSPVPASSKGEEFTAAFLRLQDKLGALSEEGTVSL
eukprot:TRINITY_DN7075_c0_g2_i1.p1 TRINITY_DN7075_c0_g2~~TRINITY_DN7075_c0_g2_i1.p1  ORF type:complete len:602 (+),score=102.06 TRINITY_DN7075_c0_g2_i1:28-1806(+)